MTNNQQVLQNNNSVTDDVNVTQQINTGSICQNQLNEDLNKLKVAEEELGPNEDAKKTAPILPKMKIDPNTPQELIALKLKNPFIGE
ncbi:hypothetical protein M0R04_02280 [Candidatus Dojkabacteria bacterium]|jgi:hypothetical protein|nr:hypothetical protein [Candidatus Dojkabacteria bacterium]